MNNVTLRSKVNLNYFMEMADNDPAAYTDLLQLVLKQQEESFLQLNQANECGNYNLLEITAYKMKAIVAFMNLSDQREHLTELEEAAQNSNPNTIINRLMREVRQRWEITAQEIQKEVSAHLK